MSFPYKRVTKFRKANPVFMRFMDSYFRGNELPRKQRDINVFLSLFTASGGEFTLRD